MSNKICFFLSKEKITGKQRVYPVLKEGIEYVINEEGVREFWLRENRDIDELALDCIRELKLKYDGIFVLLITEKYDDSKKYLYKKHDGIRIADIPSDAPGIMEYMVQEADHMISYACRSEEERKAVQYAVEHRIKNFTIYEV